VRCWLRDCNWPLRRKAILIWNLLKILITSWKNHISSIFISRLLSCCWRYYRDYWASHGNMSGNMRLNISKVSSKNRWFSFFARWWNNLGTRLSLLRNSLQTFAQVRIIVVVILSDFSSRYVVLSSGYIIILRHGLLSRPVVGIWKTGFR